MGKLLQSSSKENVPIGVVKNVPLGIPSRDYTKSQEIEQLAVEKYYKNGKGITFYDLLSKGIAQSKKQAQRKLKNCLHTNVVFTLKDVKPQQYYPSSMRAEISESIMRKEGNDILLVDSTPVGSNSGSSKNMSRNTIITASAISQSPISHESIVTESLKGQVLPLLASAPLHIHNMHFKLKITPDCYIQLNLSKSNRNNGKHHYERIGIKRHVDYTFYPNGTVNITTECSDNPFKLENESDHSILLSFLGQLRDRLLILLGDKQEEKLIPNITEWYLTEFDINKDIKVSDLLHLTALKTQVKHLDHIFRIYIKSKGPDTVCRVEQSISPNNKKPAIDAINDIFNPDERIERELHKIEAILVRISKSISSMSSKESV
jgi:hypothetical protein